jgi:hypothetical protein
MWVWLGKEDEMQNQVKLRRERPLERSTLTASMLLAAGLGALTVALIAGIKAGLRLLDGGLSAEGVPLMAVNLVTIAMAYSFGWMAAGLSAKVYHLPLATKAVRAFAWVFLLCLAALYLYITLKLFEQNYTDSKLAAYWTVMCLGVLGLAGIHLLSGQDDMRPYAFVLMLVSMVHLGAIVYHYNFLEGFRPEGLVADMLFFFSMLLVEFLMLAHFGLLRSARHFVEEQFVDVRRTMDLGR